MVGVEPTYTAYEAAEISRTSPLREIVAARGIRTPTELVLSQPPLPLGYRGAFMQVTGLEPAWLGR